MTPPCARQSRGTGAAHTPDQHVLGFLFCRLFQFLNGFIELLSGLLRRSLFLTANQSDKRDRNNQNTDTSGVPAHSALLC